MQVYQLCPYCGKIFLKSGWHPIPFFDKRKEAVTENFIILRNTTITRPCDRKIF